MNTSIIQIMTFQKLQPEIRGTRTGYVTRYTCPVCSAESIIINRIPEDYFKNIRAVSCRHCRTRLNVLTQGKEIQKERPINILR